MQRWRTIGKPLTRGAQIGRALESRSDRIRGLQSDGELMAEAGVVGAGKKRRQRRNQGDGGKSEIALAVFGVLEFLHDSGRSAHGTPAHAVFAGHDQAGV